MVGEAYVTDRLALVDRHFQSVTIFYNWVSQVVDFVLTNVEINQMRLTNALINFSISSLINQILTLIRNPNFINSSNSEFSIHFVKKSDLYWPNLPKFGRNRLIQGPDGLALGVPVGPAWDQLSPGVISFEQVRVPRRHQTIRVCHNLEKFVN